MNTPYLQENHNEKNSGYQVVMPLEIGLCIEEEAPVRMLSQISDELNYEELERAYTHNGRKLAVSPKRLFKILVFAYMNGIYSSRKIEEACKRDIHYMWLLEGKKAPDHNTIARFRKQRLGCAIEGLFYQFVSKLHEKGEIAFGDLFVDGTKIEANANRYSFVWRKSVEKNAAKMEPQLKRHMEYIQQEYGIAAQTVSELLDSMEKLRKEKEIVFVSGRGKRKTPFQRDFEKLQGYTKRLKKYQEYGEAFKGRNSFSKTDTDATFMHMKEDHMRNGQLKPGYNLQIAVEAEYIVGMDISPERSDMHALLPLLEKVYESSGKRHQTLTADAGYESEENYAYLEKNGQLCFIKPSNYQKSKTRKYRNNKYLRENMFYEMQTDTYTCPAGRKFLRTGTKTRTSKSGFAATLAIYECESCVDCEVKALCTKAKGNRRMQVSEKFTAYRQRALHDIQTQRGILLRMNRSIQVEGAFGVLKQDYNFRRFLLRGKANVLTETLLMGFSFNVNKLYSKTKNDRLRSFLFEKMIA
ncbi:MAG: IS1182 family transposase [Sporomusa sp.]